MRFKSVLLLFNIVLFIVLLSVILLPLFIIGKDFFSVFIQKNWIVLLVFFIVILGVDLYFFLNWKLFSLLEEEDWKNLIVYLEGEIYRNGRINKMRVKILLNAYLLTSNLDGILKLESYLNESKRSMVRFYSVAFSVPYLLKSDPKTAEAFFAKLLSEKGTREVDWIRWNYAFTLMQQKQFDAAKEELLRIYRESKQLIPFLMSIYFLHSYAKYDDEIKEFVEKGKKRLKTRSERKKLAREIEKSGENMEALILSQIIREANDWLYSDNNERGDGEFGNLNVVKRDEEHFH